MKVFTSHTYRATLCTCFMIIVSILLHAQTIKSVSPAWTAGTVMTEQELSAIGLHNCFKAMPISESVMARMKGKSYKENCTIKPSELRYVQVLHRNASGENQRGELVCNKAIANDIVEIFRELYLHNYRIARMVLVDEYDANDELSMEANNTSCFNFRQVAGSKTLSKHSRGMAIDINPLYNPCITVRTGKIEPRSGKQYAYSRKNNDTETLQMIDRNDLCYRLFIQHGFTWGGAWRSKKDYQHFER